MQKPGLRYKLATASARRESPREDGGVNGRQLIYTNLIDREHRGRVILREHTE
jgi:hypothetical protein